MTKTIETQRFTSELFDLLDETFLHVQGIYLDKDTSLFETLETISAAEASRPVSATCASVAAQVAHVNFYLEVLERFLRTNETVRADWGEIWRTTREVTPEEWSASKDRLRQSYQRVLETLRSIEDWNGENAIAGALAIVVHSAYHLGEIRQALCTIKQAGS